MKKHGIDLWFISAAYGFIFLFTFFSLLPFWLMISGSITGEKELLLEGYKIIPQEINFTAYRILLTSAKLLKGYEITLTITIVGTMLAVLFSSMLAYAIANRRNRFRNYLAFYVYFTMLFSGGIVPFYVLVAINLQLLDSIWALILPLLIQPFFVFLLISFFRTIPPELEDAARIDGSNEVGIFFKIIIPVSKPILATVTLFYALNYWNDWFLGVLFINDDAKYPLQLLLRRMVSNLEAAKNLIPSGASITAEAPTYQIRMATTLLTIGPIIFFYPFIQRYIVSGITIGALKG